MFQMPFYSFFKRGIFRHPVFQMPFFIDFHIVTFIILQILILNRHSYISLVYVELRVTLAGLGMESNINRITMLIIEAK
jgi:hypothetical protein